MFSQSRIFQTLDSLLRLADLGVDLHHPVVPLDDARGDDDDVLLTAGGGGAVSGSLLPGGVMKLQLIERPASVQYPQVVCAELPNLIETLLAFSSVRTRI